RSYIPVFYHRKFFDGKALGIVVGANGVYEIAGSNQVASGYVARPDNELFGIGSYRIRIGVEVADNTIYFYALLHVTRNYPAVIALFRQVFVIIESRFIGKVECPAHIAFDSIFVGSKRKESS